MNSNFSNQLVIGYYFVRIKVLVCGDSHTRIFSYCNKQQSQFTFNVCEVGGATAQGAVNPNSKTDALGIFSTKLKNTPNADKVLIMLGEVDCGFLGKVKTLQYKCR